MCIQTNDEMMLSYFNANMVVYLLEFIKDYCRFSFFVSGFMMSVKEIRIDLHNLIKCASYCLGIYHQTEFDFRARSQKWKQRKPCKCQKCNKVNIFDRSNLWQAKANWKFCSVSQFLSRVQRDRRIFT